VTVENVSEQQALREPSDVVTIIYTSGTSGESKGACLTVGNLDHMLGCTTRRLNQLMGATSEPDRVYHYLPFNFAGSWILLLACLSRSSILSLSTDFGKLSDEIRLASPHYFLNVPTLLERVRKGVEEQLQKRGGLISKAFQNTWKDFHHSAAGNSKGMASFWGAIAALLIFPKIRARFGANLRALICGSAPLAGETQIFFNMLGIRVLQVYGLTETTGICTMDDPRGTVEPGFVGPAIPQVEMTCGENQEILVRGPNIFAGYWNRPQETEAVLRGGWFHTGDQGEVSDAGNWRIVGRIKNLLILNSGHNIAPEPVEEKILSALPDAQQVILMGNGRGYLTALIAPASNGQITAAIVNTALETVNRDLPHYKQIRAFHLLREPLSIESGLLTGNGKLKRDAIGARFAGEIDALYQRPQA
jgi:long-chain acyl-CoA synthetase